MNRPKGDALLYAVIFLFLAGQTAAGSAQHAHDALIRGGQGDTAWLPWTLAGTPELLAVLGFLEYRHRRHTYGPTADVRVPRAVLVGAALILMAAQLVTAQPSILGWVAAAWPALAFLVAVLLVESRPRTVAQDTPGVVDNPSTATGSVPSPGGGGGSTATPGTISPAVAALPETARTVYAHLEAQPPGTVTAAADVKAATGLTEREAWRRAIGPLLAARLVVTPTPGRYALTGPHPLPDTEREAAS